MSDTVKQIFDQSTTVVSEVNLEDKEMIERVKQCMQLEEGALLSELVPPEMYDRINACKKFCCFFKNGENSKNVSHNSITF